MCERLRSIGVDGERLIVRYTGSDVLRRLGSLVVAAVLVAAPLSAAICNALCAGPAHMAGETAAGQTSHQHDSMAAHVHASHRHGAVSGTQRDSAATRVKPLSRACDQAGAVMPAPIERRLLAHQILHARLFLAVADVETASPLARLDNRHGPPAPVRSISPLRI
jgi:hypothetical protein